LNTAKWNPPDTVWKQWGGDRGNGAIMEGWACSKYPVNLYEISTMKTLYIINIF
jgi:hypothetical protein